MMIYRKRNFSTLSLSVFLASVRMQRLSVVPLAVLLMGTSAAVVSAADAVPTTVPMKVLARHAQVTVEINGQPLNFILDTGADENIISAKAVERLGLKPNKDTVAGSGASGEFVAQSVNIDELKIGSESMKKQTAYIIPLPEEAKFDGILGVPFFKAFVASLDYQHGQLTLNPRKSFTPPKGVEPIEMKLDSRKMLVSATAAGIQGWYSVDTGAGDALTFFRPAVEKYKLRTSFSPVVHTITGVGAGGRLEGEVVRIPELTIGPHKFTQVIAELSLAKQGFFANPTPGAIGNLGGELWRRFTVTLDVNKGKLYLEPNDAFAQPFAPPRAGFAPAFEQGSIKVVDVVAGSPAAEAGIQVGDTVLSIDSVPASQILPDELGSILRRAPGTRLALRLRNPQGTERDVTITLRDLL